MTTEAPEQVLCLPSQVCLGFAPSLAAHGGFIPSPRASEEVLGRMRPLVAEILEQLLPLAQFRERTKALEADEAWLQVIPYGVLVSEGQVLAYRRTKAGGEGRLHRRISVGLGGHVNPCDAGTGPAVGSLVPCLRRELAEEAGLTREVAPRLAGLIYDPSDDVGRVHLGAVYAVALPDVRAAFRFAPEIDWASWRFADRVAEGEVPGEWEGWSRVLMPHLAEIARLAS